VRRSEWPRAAGRLVLFALAACAAGCAHRYRVTGMVLRTNPAAGTMLVSHHDIKGYMPAMTMPFFVRDPAELRDLSPGSRIAFELRVGRGGSRAESIQVAARGLDVPVAAPAIALRPGDAVPDFELVDQTGHSARLSDFRGKIVVLNFLYTRCPLPEVCPRLAAGFARLQRRFRPSEMMLLSITLDPKHDTPAVLAGYGRIWKANPEGWRFLTGADGKIRDIAEHFGMIYWPEDGALTHTSRTAVIRRDGTLAASIEGAQFPLPQLIDLVAMEMEGKP
jgi:protein SCO1/2